jgi:hypothetical protein
MRSNQQRALHTWFGFVCKWNSLVCDWVQAAWYERTIGAGYFPAVT